MPLSILRGLGGDNAVVIGISPRAWIMLDGHELKLNSRNTFQWRQYEM
jgi:hypothetical protein